MAIYEEILAVDADEISVLILKRQFQQAGFRPEFVVAQTFVDMKKHLSKEKLPPLILIEPILPDCTRVTPVATAKAYRQQKSHIYFISHRPAPP